MRLNNLRWARGFTIIEVLIVLAIAGLIMIIIFLAVPSLQRNARNTSRKNDVASIAATISNFKTNNGNNTPDRIKNDTDETVVDIANSSNLANFESVDLGYYNRAGGPDGSWGPKADMVFIDPAGPVATLKEPSVAAPGSNGLNSNKITDDAVAIVSGETCNDTGDGAGQLAANAVAVFYVTENGSGDGNLACVTT